MTYLGKFLYSVHDDEHQHSCELVFEKDSIFVTKSFAYSFERKESGERWKIIGGQIVRAEGWS